MRKSLCLDEPMHRYPAPTADEIWSDAARARRLRQVTDAYAVETIRSAMPTSDGAELIDAIRGAPDPTIFDWRHFEIESGHEVVGFLQAYLFRLPPEVHPYVHYGLTSSDLTEYDLHQAIRSHANYLFDKVTSFLNELALKIGKYRELPRAGRTHGQTAELTTLGHQLQVFFHTLRRIQDGLEVAMLAQPIKSPGPTGFGAEVVVPWDTVPSTQILPRDFLLRWASSYLTLTNAMETMAMFVRTGSRSEIGEFVEGRAASRQGSSAMPGKRNPIESERVCGLARVARGQFLALAEVSALWEDRDLSNSSTERLMVPGLAATTEYMVDTVSRVFRELVINTDQIEENAQDARCRANALQREIQLTQQVGPIEASRLATERQNA